MHENRAAASGDTRPRVVIDLDDEIVEMILAPEPVAGFIGPALERTIIAPVGGILAPGVVRSNRPDRQLRPRPRGAIGAPPEPPQLEQAARRATVAFALVGLNPSAPERYRDGEGARDQQAFSPMPRSGTHREQIKRPAMVHAVRAAEHEVDHPIVGCVQGPACPSCPSTGKIAPQGHFTACRIFAKS